MAAWLLVPPTSPAGAKSVASKNPPLVAAAYFGSANPINFWSSDLSDARQQFERIKADGFNGVDLVVPWGDFQPSITPPSYNQSDFNRLDSLISLAKSLNLKVVLRLSYEFDVYPGDQLPWGARQLSLYGSSPVYRSWEAYLAKIHQNVQHFSNIKAEYLSWEDFWGPIWAAQGAKTPAAQLHLAHSTGYRKWLERSYSMAQVETAYGTQFASWSDVPTPSSHSPAFALMYRYVDWTMIHRFFPTAQHLFPNLTLETRIEQDTLYNGSQPAGTYPHNATWKLPGTTTTGIYYSPYMNDPSGQHQETASQAVQGLRTTLSNVKAGVGGRRIYVYEFEIMSNAAVISQAPQLATDEIPSFVVRSGPILKEYTDGYTLWTYRDFNQSLVYNPSFAMGLGGWSVTGGPKAIQPKRSTAYLAMPKGSTATQTVQPSRFQSASSKPVTVSFRAASGTRGSTLTVSFGPGVAQSVTVQKGWHSYQVHFTVAQLGSGAMTLAAAGPIQLTDVQEYTFTQVGDVYQTSGAPTPGGALHAIENLNRQLAS